MIVRNWMQQNPTLVNGDTLLSEAKRILSEHNLQALPVVDDGRLRGVITRAHCLQAAHFVARTQSADEYSFFANRLKVKDIMVRNPATVRADDTMQLCLLKGQQLGVAQFPVLDGERVVGVISANEIFQLALLEPKLAILDETDSGLDIDALKAVAAGVNAMRSPERAFLVITHYQRLLDYITPDVVHVMVQGRIIASGGPELALQLERDGYAGIAGGTH